MARLADPERHCLLFGGCWPAGGDDVWGRQRRTRKSGIRSQKGSKYGFLEHILDFSGATRFFGGKCGTSFSRGEQARHFELLFVAFYRRIVSTHEQKGAKCSRWNPFHKTWPVYFWGGRHDQHTTSHISTNIWN